MKFYCRLLFDITIHLHFSLRLFLTLFIRTLIHFFLQFLLIYFVFKNFKNYKSHKTFTEKSSMLTAQTISNKWLAIVLTNGEKQKTHKTREEKGFKISTNGDSVYRYCVMHVLTSLSCGAAKFECICLLYRLLPTLLFRLT